MSDGFLDDDQVGSYTQFIAVVFGEDERGYAPIATKVRKYSAYVQSIVDAIFESLTPREARTLRMRFGIGSAIAESSVIAYEVGIPVEKVIPVVSKALRKCRHPTRSEALAKIAFGEPSASDISHAIAQMQALAELARGDTELVRVERDAASSEEQSKTICCPKCNYLLWLKIGRDRKMDCKNCGHSWLL